MAKDLSNGTSVKGEYGSVEVVIRGISLVVPGLARGVENVFQGDANQGDKSLAEKSGPGERLMNS